MIKTPHILMISRILPQHAIGGMQLIAWDLAREWVKKGIKVTCLTTMIPGKSEHFTEEGIDVIALKNTAPAKYSRAFWRASREYFNHHLINQVSMVISISAGAYGLISLREKNPTIRWIMQAHGTSWGEVKSKWASLLWKAMLSSIRNVYWLGIDLFYYHQFDEVVAVGESVMRELHAFPISMVLPKNKVKLICNGVDETLFFPDESLRKKIREELGFNPETHVILSASRLHRQKGIHYGLQAFARYVRDYPDAFYLIAGDGLERSALEALSKELKISEKIFFLGPIQREKLNSYLAAADVFLFTTIRAEGLPLNVLEALASGLPVIMSYHLMETIKIEKGVLGVDPQDNDGIVEALRSVLSTRSSRNVLLPDEYTLKMCAQKYMNR